MAKEVPLLVNGFKVLTISYAQGVEHHLYIKAHQTSSQSSTSKLLPPGRTLFLVNLPPDATSRELSLLFKTCGTIERVLFSTGIGEDMDNSDNPENVLEDEEATDKGDEDSDEDEMEDGDQEMQHTSKKRRISLTKVEKQLQGPPKVSPLPTASLRTYRHSGHTAHIIFLDDSSLQRALDLSASSSKKKAITWPSSTEPRGLQHYLALHSSVRPPLSVVRDHADTSLEAYEYIRANTSTAIAAAASKYKKGEPIVDDDGFTLVTRSGTHGQTLGGGVGVASKRFELDMRKDAEGYKQHQTKLKKKEKEGFYTFQVREKKRKEFMDLRQKFEEDKAKIAKLKEKRKFKPY